MPSVIEIIRKRWPEAVMVMVFFGGAFFVLSQMFGQIIPVAGSESINENISLPQSTAFIYGMGTMALLMISFMLLLGFVATTYRDGARPAEPLELLKAGRYFFWRMFMFGLLLLCAQQILSLLMLSFVATAFYHIETPEEMAKIPLHVQMICGAGAAVAIVKYELMMPAVMICRDIKIPQAFGKMRYYKFGDLKNLIAIFVVFVISSQGAMLVVALNEGQGALSLAASIAYGVAMGVFTLVLRLGAVKFVTESSADPEPFPVLANDKPKQDRS